jgi:UDP-N-acetylmuramoylalanine--D-glutamate ligase
MSKKYLVVGLGITGLSVVEYLSKQGADFVITDSRANPPNLSLVQSKYPHIPMLLGAITIPEDITDVIVSPGVVVETDLPKYGDIELFAQVVDKPVLAITGSNGKSTVTTLLGEMARASGKNPGIGGNLGTPALSLLGYGHDIYILELSSFQLETTTSLKPLAATVLNLSIDHMDRYANMAEYQRAKLRIYTGAQFAITNAEDPLTQCTLSGYSFGLESGDYRVIDGYLAKDSERIMPISEMAMLGKHNVANALAALAMGDLAGFDRNAMCKVLRQFKGLEHRCEYVSNKDNILWINDSKGTNPGATLAALQGLKDAITGKWVIILGGLGKNADFAELVEPIRQACKAAILIGKEQQNFWDLLHEQLPCHLAKDLNAVVALAREIAVAGDGVLFSPACASFDMFNDYIHRGRAFKQHAIEAIHS